MHQNYMIDFVKRHILEKTLELFTWIKCSFAVFLLDLKILKSATFLATHITCDCHKLQEVKGMFY